TYWRRGKKYADLTMLNAGYIPNEELQHLFEPDHSARAQNLGRGGHLGSFFTKRAFEVMGMEFAMDSDVKDIPVVTQKIIGIPVLTNPSVLFLKPDLLASPPSREPRPIPRPPKLEPDRGSKVTIMLVDDEDIVRKFAALVLKLVGYNVVEYE